jgi:hypothetical protein
MTEQMPSQEGESSPRTGVVDRLAGVLFWGFVVLGLLALPAWSFWAGKGGNGVVGSSGAVLWCAWSGEGGAPALALTGCPGTGSPLEALVFFPGEGRAGAYLREGLRQSGIADLGECFLPPGAPCARSTEQLCREMTVRRLSLAVPLRGKTAGEELAKTLGTKGTTLGRLSPAKPESGEALWEDSSWGGGVLRIWRKGASWRGEWFPAGAEAPLLRFYYGETGETTVQDAAGRTLLTLPQRAPGGFLRIPMDSLESPAESSGDPG